MKTSLKTCLLLGALVAPVLAYAETATLSSTAVVQGDCFNGAPIAANRSQVANALDLAPDGDMFSLGFMPMGELEFSVDPPLAFREVSVWEDTWLNGSYCLETADVYVRSGDGAWFLIGTADNERGANGDYHLTTLAFDGQLVGGCVDGLKIVHTTTYEEAAGGPTGDGFDVDAIEVTGESAGCGDDGAVEAVERPQALALAGNFPNPFNPATTIRFSLAETGPARLSVHNLAGQTVAVLADGVLAAGPQEVVFDAATLPSGLYVCTLAADGAAVSHKMLLAK